MRHDHFPAAAYGYVQFRAEPRFPGQHIYSTPFVDVRDMNRAQAVSAGNPRVLSPMLVARFELAEVQEWEVDQSDEARRAWEARHPR